MKRMKRLAALAAAFSVLWTGIPFTESGGISDTLTASASEGYSYELSDTQAILYHYQNEDSIVEVPAEIGGLPVTKIDYAAFSDCPNLTTVVIPKTVRYLSASTFSDCPTLTTIIVAKDNPYFTSVNGVLFDKNQSTLIAYPKGNTDTEYTVPSSVSTIAEGAFSDCSYLQQISFDGENLFEIEDRAFENCTGLRSAALPDYARVMGANVFSGCSSLSSVELPSELSYLSSGCFMNCTNLTSIVLPDNLAEIGSGSFEGCTNLTKITIPQYVTSIDHESFSGCTSLADITIPAGVTYIGSSAFDGTPWIASYSEEYVILGDSILYQYNGTSTELVVPEGVRTVSSNTLNSQFDVITLSDSIESFTPDVWGENGVTINLGVNTKDFPMNYGNKGNLYCIVEINVPEENPYFSSEDGVLYSKDKTELICYPPLKNDLTEFVIPDTVTHIADGAFYATSLKSLTFSPNLKEIGDYAFYMSSIDFQKLILPDTVKKIGEYAFAESGISSLTLPDSLCSIGAEAFYFNDELTEVAFPEGLEEIGWAAFYSCTNLKTISFPDTITFVDGAAFEETAWLKQQPDGLLYIGKAAYQYMGEMPANSSISLKDGTTCISANAFSDCTGLRTISIPDTVESIGDCAFMNCTSLSDIEIPDSLTSIEYLTFSGCNALSSVTVPENIKLIEALAFDSCANLKDIVIENPDCQIEDNADWQGGTISNVRDSVTLGFDFYGTIHGDSSSTAEFYALRNGYAFSALDEPQTEPTSTTTEAATTTASSTTTKPVTTAATSTTKAATSATTKTTTAATTTTTQTTSATTTTDIPDTKTFTWGRDNWDFDNSYGFFSIGTYRSQINDTYVKKLKENLNNSDYAVIFDSKTGWINNMWGGSCYGMSATALLSMEGLFPYSAYGKDADCLYDLYCPLEDFEISSLITYYQMLQVKDVIQQQYRTVPNRSHATNIKAILTQLDSSSTALVGFQKAGWGGHAILAYDYSYGSWTWDGVTYDGCIYIADPNHSMSYDKSCNIYFNSSTYQWAIPFYSGSRISSAYGAVFNYIGSSVSEINQGGYLSGSANSTVSDFVARMDAPTLASNHTVEKVKKTNGGYMMMNAAAGEIVADYSYIIGGESEGIYGYNLFDADSAYRVTQDAPQKLELTVDYENCLMKGSSAAGSEIVFDKNGYVSVKGESADYSMEMVYDDNYPTCWFAFGVEGQNADTAAMEMVDGGYILSADRLQNVSVTASNKEVTASTRFSTEYTEVFLYEIDEQTIGISVDTDGDGTYETPVAGEAASDLGDLNADSEVNASDAAMILVAAAAIGSGSDSGLTEMQKNAADLNKDSAFDAVDAALVLQYAAYSGSGGTMTLEEFLAA